MVAHAVWQPRTWRPEQMIPPAESDLLPVLTHEDFRTIARDEELQRLERMRCETDVWYWLVNYAVTRDEHDERHPHKRFPPLPYLRALAHLWWTEPLLALPKSRKMLVTWLVELLYLADAQFRSSRLEITMAQGQDEVKLIHDRGRFTYERQPFWIRTPLAGEWGAQHVVFANDSRMMAVPSGEAQIQGPAPSGFFMDEVGDHAEAARTFEAALAAVKHGRGGRMTMVGRRPRSWWHDIFLANLLGKEETTL